MGDGDGDTNESLEEQHQEQESATADLQQENLVMKTVGCLALMRTIQETQVITPIHLKKCMGEFLQETTVVPVSYL